MDVFQQAKVGVNRQRISLRRSLGRELAITTALLAAISHLLYRFRFLSWIDHSLSVLIALFFLYTPIILLWRAKRPIDFLDHGMKAHVRSVIVFIVTALIIFPPFFLAAHAWQIWGGQAGSFHFARYPSLYKMILFQLIMVALPEEFYFRGYFQSTIDRLFPKSWHVLGVKLGWGWLITAAVFAIAHSIVTYRWWHFSIFFPALLFGYLRERTGSITAPVFFHAASNLFMDWFTRCYY